MSKIFAPYNLAMDIDYSIRAAEQSSLTPDEFCDIAEALQFAGNAEKQNALADILKTLPKTHIVERARKLIKLNGILKKIKYDIPSAQNRKINRTCG